MRFIVGIDEAGRGPLAGPVAVGAVMVAEGFDVAAEFPGVADSKKLSEKKREMLFALLEKRALCGDLWFVVEMESAATIDQEGIVPAVKTALSRAHRVLAADPAYIQVQLDGALAAPEQYLQETIIGGDASVPLISLASIAAKVIRDRLLVSLSETYPGYGFEKHKGYGTQAHYASLRELGPCAIHRRSFLKIA